MQSTWVTWLLSARCLAVCRPQQLPRLCRCCQGPEGHSDAPQGIALLTKWRSGGCPSRLGLIKCRIHDQPGNDGRSVPEGEHRTGRGQGGWQIFASASQLPRPSSLGGKEPEVAIGCVNPGRYDLTSNIGQVRRFRHISPDACRSDAAWAMFKDTRLYRTSRQWLRAQARRQKRYSAPKSDAPCRLKPYVKRACGPEVVGLRSSRCFKALQQDNSPAMTSLLLLPSSSAGMCCHLTQRLRRHSSQRVVNCKLLITSLQLRFTDVASSYAGAAASASHGSSAGRLSGVDSRHQPDHHRTGAVADLEGIS